MVDLASRDAVSKDIKYVFLQVRRGRGRGARDRHAVGADQTNRIAHYLRAGRRCRVASTGSAQALPAGSRGAHQRAQTS